MTSKKQRAMNEELSDYRFSRQVGFLLRRAYQRHVAIFQAGMADPQLTTVQFSTLCALRDSGPQSQAELVKATGVDQATIRGVLTRLRHRGHVAAAPDATDARKVVLSITDAGRALLHEAIPRAIAITEETLAPLNPGERLALLYTLRLIGDEAGSISQPAVDNLTGEGRK